MHIATTAVCKLVVIFNGACLIVWLGWLIVWLALCKLAIQDFSVLRNHYHVILTALCSNSSALSQASSVYLGAVLFGAVALQSHYISSLLTAIELLSTVLTTLSSMHPLTMTSNLQTAVVLKYFHRPWFIVVSTKLTRRRSRGLLVETSVT